MENETIRNLSVQLSKVMYSLLLVNKQKFTMYRPLSLINLSSSQIVPNITVKCDIVANIV
jgi:hypothetical protein